MVFGAWRVVPREIRGEVCLFAEHAGLAGNARDVKSWAERIARRSVYSQIRGGRKSCVCCRRGGGAVEEDYVLRVVMMWGWRWDGSR